MYLYSAYRRELMPVNTLLMKPYDFCFAWCTYILSVEVVFWYIALESLFIVR